MSARHLLIFAALPLLAGCGTTAARVGNTPPAPAAPTVTSPPPQVAQPSRPSAGGFIAPRVMNREGLENVIGRNSEALVNIFGTPRLDVREGDARKLQFSGEPCVLDIYLYPLQPGAEPTATYVDARRASDGLDVDRVACARALGGM